MANRFQRVVDALSAFMTIWNVLVMLITAIVFLAGLVGVQFGLLNPRLVLFPILVVILLLFPFFVHAYWQSSPYREQKRKEKEYKKKQRVRIERILASPKIAFEHLDTMQQKLVAGCVVYSECHIVVERGPQYAKRRHANEEIYERAEILKERGWFIYLKELSVGERTEYDYDINGKLRAAAEEIIKAMDDSTLWNFLIPVHWAGGGFDFKYYFVSTGSRLDSQIPSALKAYNET